MSKSLLDSRAGKSLLTSKSLLVSKSREQNADGDFYDVRKKVTCRLLTSKSLDEKLGLIQGCLIAKLTSNSRAAGLAASAV